MTKLNFCREQVANLAKMQSTRGFEHCIKGLAEDCETWRAAVQAWRDANHAYAANAHVEEAAARYDALDAAERALAAMVEEQEISNG